MEKNFWNKKFFTTVLSGGLHWSASDSKSPQFSRTLSSIVADLNNAVVWTVSISILPRISSSANLFFSLFRICSKETDYRTFQLSSCSLLFKSLAKVQLVFQFFHFPLYSFCSLLELPNPLVNEHKVWSFDKGDLFYISKSLRILCIFQDRFCSK